MITHETVTTTGVVKSAPLRVAPGRQIASVPLARLHPEDGVQTRTELNESVAQEYCALMSAGVKLEPVKATYDQNGKFHLFDGHHRCWACEMAGLNEIEVEIYPGTRSDAEWLGCAANQGQGLRRSRQDTRRAIEMALKHPNGVKMTDNAIAAHVGVDHKTVAAVRGELEARWEIPKVRNREVRRGDTTFVVNVDTIAKARRAPARQRSADEPAVTGTLTNDGPTDGASTPPANSKAATPVEPGGVSPATEVAMESEPVFAGEAGARTTAVARKHSACAMQASQIPAMLRAATEVIATQSLDADVAREIGIALDGLGLAFARRTEAE